MKARVIHFILILLALSSLSTKCTKEEEPIAGKIIAEFSISPESGPVSTEFKFNATASYYENGLGDGFPVNCNWDFQYTGEGDIFWDVQTTSEYAVTYTYDEPGTYLVLLEVSYGNYSKQKTKSLTVTEGTNKPPVATFTIDPEDWYTTDIFDFNAMESWDNEDDVWTLKMRWDWETDGIFDTEWELYEYSAIKAHWFDEPGDYTVTLQVKDTEEAIGSATAVATVFPFWFDIPCPDIPTVDYEGKTYNTVIILHQCWLRESLDLGTRHDFGVNSSDNGQIEKYCYHNLDANCDKYGGMYQWDEMMNYTATEGGKGICPVGWHIPSLNDKSILSQSLLAIGENVGKQLQHPANNCEGNCDNLGLSGFDFLLGGLSADPTSTTEGLSSWFWLSKESSAVNAEYLLVDYNNTGWNSPISGIEKTRQAYVRCLKDE